MTDVTTPSVAAAPVTEAVTAPTTPAPVSTLLDATADASSTVPAEGANPAEPAIGAEDGPKPDDAPQGAPAEYEQFTLPEGITFDAEVETNLKSLSKDLNLTQTQAQQVADLGAQLSQTWTQSLQAHIDATSAAWEQAAKADKEIGGDKLPENLGLAKTVLDKFGSPELRDLLKQSRLGNNPEVIRLLSKVGLAISDDNRMPTGKPPSEQSKARTMFPSAQG